jgi:hypothetical protein
MVKRSLARMLSGKGTCSRAFTVCIQFLLCVPVDALPSQLSLLLHKIRMITLLSQGGHAHMTILVISKVIFLI